MRNYDYLDDLEQAKDELAEAERRKLESAPIDLAAAFAALTDEERGEIAAPYCNHCWRLHPQGGICQCWNDE